MIILIFLRCCDSEHILNAGKTVNAEGKSNELLRCENNGAIRYQCLCFDFILFNHSELSGSTGDLENLCLQYDFSNTANVTLEHTPGECMDGKFQSFYFGEEGNKFNIPYIKLDSSTNEILVKNLPSQRIVIPISDPDYCVSAIL